MDRQPRLIDLIPQRPSSFVLLFLAGLTVVAGLEAAYLWMPEIAAFAGTHRLTALDLDGDNSLATWFSSTLLVGAGLVALLIYSIRRQKPDDYHGRYRVYLWAALAWFTMSLDAASSLHHAFAQAMSHIAGTKVHGEGAIWWVVGYALVLTPICLRLVMDMRRCRSSTALFVLAAIGYLTAIAVRLDTLLPQRNPLVIMIEEAGELLGHLFLLLSMAVHARYVIRGAQGLLPVEKTKAERSATKPKTAAAANLSSSASKRSDLDSPAKSTSSPLAASMARAKTTRSDEDDYDDEDDDRQSRRPRSQQRIDEEEDAIGDRKLNKAQLKALRRQKEAQRRREG